MLAWCLFFNPPFQFKNTAGHAGNDDDALKHHWCSHWLIDYGLPFGLTTFLGIMSLMGIVVRNGIILIDYAEELRTKME